MQEVCGHRHTPEHSRRRGMSPEDRARIDAFYEERYGVDRP